MQGHVDDWKLRASGPLLMASIAGGPCACPDPLSYQAVSFVPGALLESPVQTRNPRLTFQLGSLAPGMLLHMSARAAAGPQAPYRVQLACGPWVQESGVLGHRGASVLGLGAGGELAKA